MTVALCVSCGEIKWGAICPCPACGVSSTGDFQLDVLFSDHTFARPALEQLGGCVRAIAAAGPSAKGEERFWCLMLHLSLDPSELLSVTLPEQLDAAVRELYLGVRFPPLDLQTRTPEPSPEGNAEGGCAAAFLLLLIVIGVIAALT